MKPILAVLALSALPAVATVLPVGNASFETPSLAANSLSGDLANHWDRNGGPNGGSWIERIPGFAAEGANHLALNNGNRVTQHTGHAFQPNTVYTLTVSVGNRTGQTVTGNGSTYELTAGSLALGVSASVDASTAAPAGQFADAAPISLNTALIPELVGRPIQVNLIAFGEGRSHFDNIRLETTSLLVTNKDASGPGSLRRATTEARDGDTILFDPAIFNGEPDDTIVLSSEINVTGVKIISVDARNIPGGVTVSGGGVTRCFVRTGIGGLTLRGLTITNGRGDHGGAISVAGSGVLMMDRCTMMANTGTTAGGAMWVSDEASATILNSTFAGNTAPHAGALLHESSAVLTLRHCTIAGNTGTNCCGGLVARGPVTLDNSILAGNTGTFKKDVSLETTGFTRAGRNIIGSNDSIEAIFPAGNPNVNGDRAGTPAAPLDPRLSALSFNGGTSLTRLPLPGSPVINSGLASATTPATDQRGAVRTQGSAPEPGAVEVEWNGGVTTTAPRLAGLWTFDDSTNIARASAGHNLTVFGSAPAWSANQADDSGKRLSGVITTVQGAANRLAAAHGIPSNGGGLFVNRYTLLMDILSPPASRGFVRSLLQTNSLNSNDTDYYLFEGIMGNGPIGFTPPIDVTRWQRIVITVQNGTSLQTWVNGSSFHTHTADTVDGRMSLDTTALFFADDFNENAPIHVGAIAMWNGVLSAADIAALGGPGDPIPPDGQITTPVDEVTALPFADNANGEAVDNAHDDDTGTKYVNRQKLYTGLEIVPALGVTRLTGLRLTSANDVTGRDPASFTILGRTGNRPWLPVAAGTVPAFSGRTVSQEFRFTGVPPACDRYRVIFPTLADVTADAMQIAEVALLGTPVDRTLRVTQLAYRGTPGNNHRFTVVWTAEPYATYGLQSSANFQQPWTLIGTGMTSSSAAGYQAFTFTSASLRGFFRILKER